MKISELNTNSFLNTTGAPENSYLLINYAAGQGVTPSTQKTSLNTIAKAVAAELNLPIAVTDGSNNITGFKKVSIAGNSYQMTDLAANLGGGGNSGSGDDEETGPYTDSVYAAYDGSTRDAYPIFYIPDENIIVTLGAYDSDSYAYPVTRTSDDAFYMEDYEYIPDSSSSDS